MDLPHEAPVMTLPNVILFPHAMLPLFIFEPRYRQMLADMLDSQRMFCVAMQRPGFARETPSPIAGIGMIRACVTKKDGTSNLILQGLGRVRLAKTLRYKPYRVCRIEELQSAPSASKTVTTLSQRLLHLLGERLQQGFAPPLHLFKKVGEQTPHDPAAATDPTLIKEGIEFLAKLNEPEQLVDLISCSLLPDPLERQTILETLDLENRLQCLIHFLIAEIARIKKDHKPAG